MSPSPLGHGPSASVWAIGAPDASTIAGVLPSASTRRASTGPCSSTSPCSSSARTWSRSMVNPAWVFQIVKPQPGSFLLL